MTAGDKDPRVTVLISSFDGFKECWPAVCHGFAKYWPDCPFSVRLMTNELDFPNPAAEVLRVSGGKVWGDRMLSAMERISSPFVMYFQEDYWIRERVDTARLVGYLDLMERERLNYVRLLANPRPDAPFPADPRLGILFDEAPYRTSSQVAFWRSDTLRALLVPGESVWDFEVVGSKRSAVYGPTFLSAWNRGGDDYFHGISYICTAINRGRWARMAHDYARREGLFIDFSARPTESWRDEFLRTVVGQELKKWIMRFHFLFSDPRSFLEKARLRFGRNR